LIAGATRQQHSVATPDGIVPGETRSSQKRKTGGPATHRTRRIPDGSITQCGRSYRSVARRQTKSSPIFFTRRRRAQNPADSARSEFDDHWPAGEDCADAVDIFFTERAADLRRGLTAARVRPKSSGGRRFCESATGTASLIAQGVDNTPAHRGERPSADKRRPSATRPDRWTGRSQRSSASPVADPNMTGMWPGRRRARALRTGVHTQNRGIQTAA
jgi:hypothetical protein